MEGATGFKTPTFGWKIYEVFHGRNILEGLPLETNFSEANTDQILFSGSMAFYYVGHKAFKKPIL